MSITGWIVLSIIIGVLITVIAGFYQSYEEWKNPSQISLRKKFAKDMECPYCKDHHPLSIYEDSLEHNDEDLLKDNAKGTQICPGCNNEYFYNLQTKKVWKVDKKQKAKIEAKQADISPNKVIFKPHSDMRYVIIKIGKEEAIITPDELVNGLDDCEQEREV